MFQSHHLKMKKTRTKQRKSGRSEMEFLDSDGEEGFKSTHKTLENYLDQLSAKGKSKRDEALFAIVQALAKEVRQVFVEKNLDTLLYWFLSSMKSKKSAKNVQLAAQGIGLLGIMVQDENLAHHVFEESIPLLSEALESGSDSNIIPKILDCLAIVSFFGSEHLGETESAMQVIWQFLNPKFLFDADDGDSESGYTDVVIVRKHSAAVVAAAVTAWSFLLTTLQGWRVSHKYWKGAIPYLSNLLEESDESVFVAASEALALVFETNGIEKFWLNAAVKDSTDSSDTCEAVNSEKKQSFKQELKDNITKQLRCRAKKASSSDRHKSRLDVLKFFEDDICLGTSTKVGREVLQLSSCSQIIQLNFMKHFLGDGFVKHMYGNEHLQRIFEFTGGQRGSETTLYVPEREETSVRFYQPGALRREDSSLLPFTSRKDKKMEKRMTMSPSSSLNKARTRVLNKQRMLSQAENVGHFMVDD